MNKELQDAFEVLRSKFGSHSAASRWLGINRDHYCAMRNGRVPIPERTAGFIILKAQELSLDVPFTAQGVASPPPEARA